MSNYSESPPGGGFPLIRPFLNRSTSTSLSETTAGGDSVRAYVMTGGRAKSNAKLDFQAMLSIIAGSQDKARQLTFERAKVYESCRAEALSVAEVAVRVGVPIGVIQILAGDLIEEGFLKPHTADRNLHSDIAFLERLSHGIRAL